MKISLTKHANETLPATGYVKWLPARPGSKILVKWIASEPWGPWRVSGEVANGSVRHLGRLPARLSDKGVVARY